MVRFVVLLALSLLLVLPGAGSVSAQGQSDQERFDAILTQIGRFWKQTLRADGYKHKDPTLMLVEGKIDTSCGRVDVEVVAAYCPGDATILLAPEPISRLASEYGDFVPVVAVAHEWGHHIQATLGVREKRTVKMELQADCLAGAALGNAAEEGLVDRGDIRSAVELTRAELGDPEWLPRDSDEAHGSADERVSNFLAGYRDGVGSCELDGLLTSAVPAQEEPIQDPLPEPAPEPAPEPVQQVDPPAEQAQVTEDAPEPITTDPATESAEETRRDRRNRRNQEEPPVEEAPVEEVPVEELPVEEIPVTVAPAPAPAPVAPALSGRVIVASANLVSTDAGCAGSGDFEDVAPGLPVAVLDADGNELGFGALGAGVLSADGAHCSLRFTIEGLTPSTVWEVIVGDRDGVIYDESLLATTGYRIAMRFTEPV
jgi:uncharacterized protein